MPLIQSLSELVHVAGVKISIFSVICKSGEGHWHLRAPMVIFCFVFFLVGDCYLFWVFVFVLLGGGSFFSFFFFCKISNINTKSSIFLKDRFVSSFQNSMTWHFYFFYFYEYRKPKIK